MPARVAKNATLRLGATTPARVTKSTILELTKKGFSGTMLLNYLRATTRADEKIAWRSRVD